jgi:hypothetical protein
MNFIVTLVLAVAGGAVVAAIAYRGIQLVWSGERQHTGEWLVGLGLGGGLIAGCKIIGAAIVGFAVGAPFAEGPGLGVSDVVGYLSGDVLYYGAGLALSMRLWWLTKQAVIYRRATHAG